MRLQVLGKRPMPSKSQGSGRILVMWGNQVLTTEMALDRIISILLSDNRILTPLSGGIKCVEKTALLSNATRFAMVPVGGSHESYADVWSPARFDMTISSFNLGRAK